MPAPYTTLAPTATPGKRYTFVSKTAVPIDLSGRIRVVEGYQLRVVEGYAVRVVEQA